MVIIAKIYIGKFLGKLQKILKNLRIPICFEDILVNFSENQGNQTCHTLKHLNKEEPERFFINNKTTFVSGKFLHKFNYKGFALEIVEEKGISLCGQQVKITGVPGVFHSEKCLEVTNGNPKITKKMFLSSVIDNFNFELLKEREIFLVKIRTLQCEIKGLRIQTRIVKSKTL